jgi:hypothetical protein
MNLTSFSSDMIICLRHVRSCPPRCFVNVQAQPCSPIEHNHGTTTRPLFVMSQSESSQRPRKLRRNRRACDQCSARSVKCRPTEGPSCEACRDYGETCTSLRPMARRGPKPRSTRSITSQPRSDGQETPGNRRPVPSQVSSVEQEAELDTSVWRPRMTPPQAIVMDLTEIYFEVVYPVFPLFHRATLLRKVARGEYATSRPLFSAVLAVSQARL